MKASLEGKLSPMGAVWHITSHILVFAGGIFAARYVNMIFDKIHSQKREELPPGLDSPVKTKR